MSHDCRAPEKTKMDQRGMAVYYCDEVEETIEHFKMEKGELWVGNLEYESQVNFCPFCGYEAKIKIKE